MSIKTVRILVCNVCNYTNHAIEQDGDFVTPHTWFENTKEQTHVCSDCIGKIGRVYVEREKEDHS